MNIYIGEPIILSDMQGPCPDGFHVPLTTEWQAIFDAGVSLGVWSSSDKNGFSSYLKIPKAGWLLYDGTTKTNVGAVGYYWSSSPKEDSDYYSYRVQFGAYGTIPQSFGDRSIGCSVRGIKDTPVIPTSSWTTLYQGTGSAGIFYNSTDGLISISSNGTTWYTIMDKNLGATTVYNNGDTLTDANCGNVFQRGNNYKFPGTKSSSSITTSSTTVDTTGYGPGNYYDSSTFITVSHDWSSVNNTNLRGGVSQGTYTKYFQAEVKNIYIGEYGWKPGANTLLYLPLESDTNDHSPNPKTITLNGTVTQDTIGYNFNGGYLVSSAFTGPTTHTTMSIWAKPNGIRSNYQALFSKYYGSFTYPYATTSIGISDNTSNADFSIGNSSATLRNVLASLTMGSWQLITGTYDGSNIKIYINGQLISSISESGSILSNNTQLSIANYLGTSQLFYGNLSEAIFENRSWTAQEIAEYYNQTKSNYGL